MFHELQFPTTWDQFETSVLADTILSNPLSDPLKPDGLAQPWSDVTKYFGVKAARTDREDAKTLERHLRPFVIERRPEETQRAIQDLMDPRSVASMQILMSYMTLLLSNDLLMDDAIQAFLAKDKELNQLGNLKPLFSNGSPTSKAVSTRILHAAICIGATSFLSQALHSGADLESPSTGDCSLTLLQKALEAGQLEAAQTLIGAGADVNAGLSVPSGNQLCKNHVYHVKGFTCECQIRGLQATLSLAARSRTCVNLIPDLIRKGAKVPEHNPVLLHAVWREASAETVSCLIDAGADVNECAMTDRMQPYTPLSAAAKRVDMEVVKLLLDAGADPNGPLKPELIELFCSHESLDEMFLSPLLCVLDRTLSFNDRAYEIVRLLLECGADPNASALDVCLGQYKGLDKGMISQLYGRLHYGAESLLLYPLQAAAKHDTTEVLELLIQHNATVNTKYGTPALAVAVEESRIGTVRFLLSQGADPNGVGKQYYCRSPLEAAVETDNFELIDLLLASGADINKCSASYGGHTPLQRAAKIGQERIIEHLLQHGASMLSLPAPIKGASVLAGLIHNRLHKYISQALKAGASPSGISVAGSSPLAAAVVNDDITSLQILLAAGADVHEYASAELPDHGDRDVPDEDYDLFNGSLMSPIQWAAALNHVEAARVLCEAGANIDQPPWSPSDDMALHLAVSRGHYAMTRFLITRKAQVNAYSNSATPLAAAIWADDVQMLTLLLKNGADPNQAKLQEPCSLLDQACENGTVDIVKTLLRAGAAMDEGFPLIYVFSGRNISGERVQKILELLLGYGVNVNKREYDDHTGLQMAILVEMFDCAYQLIEAGACINAIPSKGDRGVTALQAAASVGDVEMVEYLLSKGAEVNAPAAVANGVTALQAAAIKGHLRIAQILLEHGADVDAKAGIENGRTAIEGAAEFGRMDMVKLLLDNYQGSKSIFEMRDVALKAAEKGNQWFVMEMLKTHE